MNSLKDSVYASMNENSNYLLPSEGCKLIIKSKPVGPEGMLAGVVNSHSWALNY